jgi:hypothetical protein
MSSQDWKSVIWMARGGSERDKIAALMRTVGGDYAPISCANSRSLPQATPTNDILAARSSCNANKGDESVSNRRAM